MKHQIEIDGTTLNYTSIGTGTPVICIHGNPGSSEDFKTEPVTGYRIIAVDRPGHGNSSRYPATENHLETQTELIRQFATALNLDTVILAGHSWGCLIALSCAMAFQERVSDLILFAPIAYPREFSNKPTNGLVTAMNLPVIGRMVTSLLSATAGKKAITEAMENGFHPQPMPEAYRLTTLPRFVSPDTFKAVCEDKADFEFRAGQLSQRYSSLQTKTWIVCGDKDSVTESSSQGDRLVSTLPNADIRFINNMGHQIPQLCPEALKESLELITPETSKAS